MRTLDEGYASSARQCAGPHGVRYPRIMYRDLSAQLAAKEIELAALHEELEVMKAQGGAKLDELQAENERLRRQVADARAERENDNRDAVLRNALSQRDQLEAENAQLRAEHAEARQALARMKLEARDRERADVGSRLMDWLESLRK
jgi:hypothetical protein